MTDEASRPWIPPKDTAGTQLVIDHGQHDVIRIRERKTGLRCEIVIHLGKIRARTDVGVIDGRHTLTAGLGLAHHPLPVCLEHVIGLRPVAWMEDWILEVSLRHHVCASVGTPEGHTVIPGDEPAALLGFMLARVRTELVVDRRRDLDRLSLGIDLDPALHGAQSSPYFSRAPDA